MNSEIILVTEEPLLKDNVNRHLKNYLTIAKYRGQVVKDGKKK